MGMPWAEILTGLRRSHSQLRLVVVPTESGALIVDDSYNASPESTLAALNLLEEIEGRRVAVLGDMLELAPTNTKGMRSSGGARPRWLKFCDGRQMADRLLKQPEMPALPEENIITCDDVPQGYRGAWRFTGGR